MMKKDFLSITDCTPKEIWQILHLAIKMKKTAQFHTALSQKTLVMIFEKPSLRTRLSFETGMKQLGGNAVYLTGKEIGLGVRESIEDIAHVISGMADIVMARTYQHQVLTDLAKYSSVPIINGLSDLEHPCQTLADLLTIYECKEKLKNINVTFIGDGENNVAHSLALGCAILGTNFICASPSGYFLKPEIFVKAQNLAYKNGTTVQQMIDPSEAIKNADVVYTDTWVSMGDEKEAKKRLNTFKNYQVTPYLMQKAKKDAIFMHDMPAHRGKEVAAEVIDRPQSVIYHQAENRLHAQKALLVYLLQAYKPLVVYSNKFMIK